MRSSIVYFAWVQRNKGTACLHCRCADNLVCHHITELYHSILGAWKLHKDWELAFREVLLQHQHDMVPNATLCAACHDATHVGTNNGYAPHSDENPLSGELWLVYPRKLNVTFVQSDPYQRPGTVGFRALQILFGIGWYILNGHMDCRIIRVKRRAFAKLLGKQPGTSFNRALGDALTRLRQAGILDAFAVPGPTVEMHVARSYLQQLQENPWFLALEEVSSSKSMPELTLRWWLGFVRGRSAYKIRVQNLAKHLNLQTPSMAYRRGVIERACKAIPYAQVLVSSTDVCQFKLNKRPAVPIIRLRTHLWDCLAEFE